MANKTQTISKTASKTTIKTAPKIVSTNDAARAKAQAASLPATNLQASAKVSAARKAAQAPKTAAPSGAANLIAMIVEGVAKRIAGGSSYYATALAYHKKAGTLFPRARNNEARAALKVDDVEQVFDMHDKKILASGNSKGQAMFDIYMMQRT